MDWIDLAQNMQVADSCQCGNKPSDFHKIPRISSLAKELGALYSILLVRTVFVTGNTY
jgi:hypothetical protein